jgi:hypothetical protein
MSVSKVLHDIYFEQAMGQKRRMERARAQAIAESKAHGRISGDDRLPLAVISDSALSDTAIHACLIALDEGREERRRGLSQSEVAA